MDGSLVTHFCKTACSCSRLAYDVHHKKYRETAVNTRYFALMLASMVWGFGLLAAAPASWAADNFTAVTPGEKPVKAKKPKQAKAPTPPRQPQHGRKQGRARQTSVSRVSWQSECGCMRGLRHLNVIAAMALLPHWGRSRKISASPALGAISSGQSHHCAKPLARTLGRSMAASSKPASASIRVNCWRARVMPV